MIPDDFKIPTPKEVREIWQRLTPEQRKMISEEIAEAIARFRRSKLSSSVAGDVKTNGIFDDTLLRVNNWT
jgi:hypothetical protein